jgi:hypothetical protein
MPRKSAASLEITPPSRRSNRLRPPATLSEPERNLFVAILGNCSHDHFQQSDLPLLCRYVEASILAERAAQQLREAPVVDGKPSPWLVVQEKSVRTLTALSMRLRLSPQARSKGHVLPTKPRTDPGGLGIGWWQLQDEGGDGDDNDSSADQRG